MINAHRSFVVAARSVILRMQSNDVTCMRVCVGHTFLQYFICIQTLFMPPLDGFGFLFDYEWANLIIHNFYSNIDGFTIFSGARKRLVLISM